MIISSFSIQRPIVICTQSDVAKPGKSLPRYVSKWACEGTSAHTVCEKTWGYHARMQGVDLALIMHKGNRYVRSIAIQIAWGWLRYQPESKLTHWYEKRFGHGGKRLRKIGIVALARKLLIDCWYYLETGLVPEVVELNQVRL